MSAYARPLSPVERAWLVASALYPPFVNQLVLEGDAPAEVARWRDGLAAVVAANPGAAVVLRGPVCRARWVVAGEAPRVREVDGTAWDGRSETGAGFLLDRLDPWRGPTTEVLVVRGEPPRVILRTHHATMDGGGTLAVADDLFRALRGEPLVGAPDTVTDLALAGAGGRGHGLPPPDALAPTGPAEGDPGSIRWMRVTLPEVGPQLLGRVAVALARLARTHGDGVVRFQVPADLRRGHPEVRSTANLTGFLHLEVPPDADAGELADAIRAAHRAGAHADNIRAVAWMRHLPLWLMTWGSRRGATAERAAGRHGASGVLSNLGRLDLSRWRAPGFTTRGCFFVPPGTAATCVFFAASGHEHGVDLVAAVPAHLASGGRLEALMAVVTEAVQRV